VTRIAVADVGGTNARFAVATIEGRRVTGLGECIRLKTRDFRDFEQAWTEVERRAGAPPKSVSVAIAGPVLNGRVTMTNGPWTIDLAKTKSSLGLEEIIALNDFDAVAHAVAQAPAEDFAHICGPDQRLPEQGTISVIGPGTGLGIAHLHRFPGGYHVQATEGGHIGFAPQDELDDRILADLRARYGRVVTERVHSGPGISHIYAALGGTGLADREIWERGIAGTDEAAVRAVARFCASLGTAAGDYALAHGAKAVVIAGGVGQRLRDLLPASDFGERFKAKPRYEEMMAGIPVKLITHPEPGLLGAAAAFAARF
jgi:glucokinase